MDLMQLNMWESNSALLYHEKSRLTTDVNGEFLEENHSKSKDRDKDITHQ